MKLTKKALNLIEETKNYDPRELEILRMLEVQPNYDEDLIITLWGEGVYNQLVNHGLIESQLPKRGKREK